MLPVKLVLVFLYLIFAIWLMRKNLVMVMLLPGVLLSPLSFFSILLIEAGAYITEQGITGYENGTFYIFYAYSVLSLILIFAFLSRYKVEIKYGNSGKYFILYSFVYALMLFYAISINPGYTRFSIFDNIPDGLRRLFAYTMIGYNFIYIYAVFKEKSFWRKIVYLFIFISIELLRGEQFGGIYYGMMSFTVATIIQYGQGNRIVLMKIEKRRLAIVSIIFITILVSLVSYKISNLGGLFKFADRIILQQHVLWGTVNLHSSGNFSADLTPYFDNFFSLAAYRTNTEYGIGQLMVALSGDLARKFIEEGVRFTSGYPAILLFHFGYLGAFLINIILTYIFVLLIRFQFFLLNKFNFIVFIIGMKQFSAFKQFYRMGEYGLINIKFILATWLLFILLLIFYRRREKFVIPKFDLTTMHQRISKGII